MFTFFPNTVYCAAIVAKIVKPGAKLHCTQLAIGVRVHASNPGRGFADTKLAINL